MSSYHVPPVLSLRTRIFEVSRAESERGFIALMVSYLESQLSVLVGKRMELNCAINDTRARKVLPSRLLNNIGHLRKIRDVFAQDWEINSLDHPNVKHHVDSLCIDPSLVMPDRSHSKAYVSNVLVYTAIELADELGRR
ncbi:hypothetical protein [Xylophilus sp. ASV27]|uniref:hypothetical protein n=1 Tax=Xylophilus sp. ASV27 TaxID=2795129 RepID=UPI0018EBD32F|nr:hypothetical protein [Xylophilus sp. ASV27]